jgi:predicted phage-related endonuclease
VSASEVGALLGSHPYQTAQTVYDRLTAPYAPANGPSEAMRIGSWLELGILRFAEHEDGFKSRANSRTYEHPRVRLCATPDAFVIGRHPFEFAAGRSLIEVKMSARWDRFKELPADIEWQCRAQMAVTDRNTVYVYALVGMALKRYVVYRDDGEERRMLNTVGQFWTDHIVPRVRPDDPEPELIEYKGVQK